MRVFILALLQVLGQSYWHSYGCIGPRRSSPRANTIVLKTYSNCCIGPKQTQYSHPQGTTTVVQYSHAQANATDLGPVTCAQRFYIFISIELISKSTKRCHVTWWNAGATGEMQGLRGGMYWWNGKLLAWKSHNHNQQINDDRKRILKLTNSFATVFTNNFT